MDGVSKRIRVDPREAVKRRPMRLGDVIEKRLGVLFLAVGCMKHDPVSDGRFAFDQSLLKNLLEVGKTAIAELLCKANQCRWLHAHTARDDGSGA